MFYDFRPGHVPLIFKIKQVEKGVKVSHLNKRCKIFVLHMRQNAPQRKHAPRPLGVHLQIWFSVHIFLCKIFVLYRRHFCRWWGRGGGVVAVEACDNNDKSVHRSII